jgi:phosphatidate cytidylyltransferase
LSFKLESNSQVKLSFYGLTGLIYIAGSLLSGLYIWENYQNTLMMIIMIGIFISDTSAYIIGTQIGKHALAKNISPNKTIEGSIGSFIFTIIFFIMIYVQNISIFTNINTTIFFAINLNISAQIGDIIISTLKRKADVKNTGVIMPGHGGCLDRIDSVLLSLLTTHLFLWSIL